MKKTKNQSNPVMDERQREITGKALNIAGGFLALCMVIAVILDLILTGEPGWEFFALVGACLVFLIANKRLGDIQPPKSWCGKLLPTGDSREDKAIRRRSYLINSLLLGGVFGFMDVILYYGNKEYIADMAMVQELFPSLQPTVLMAITALLVFIIIFGISYLVEYLYHEKYELNAYRKMLADLDEE